MKSGMKFINEFGTYRRCCSCTKRSLKSRIEQQFSDNRTYFLLSTTIPWENILCHYNLVENEMSTTCDNKDRVNLRTLEHLHTQFMKHLYNFNLFYYKQTNNLFPNAVNIDAFSICTWSLKEFDTKFHA